ncbi:peptidase C45 [Babesia caballi]|uniref:Peptidase C45 n=1 Tax=Babesia caballi TaxID=5871 RepID=A0AAV4LX56_BABCB|nr:peptidase C45 [Babesia caballi]
MEQHSDFNPYINNGGWVRGQARQWTLQDRRLRGLEQLRGGRSRHAAVGGLRDPHAERLQTEETDADVRDRHVRDAGRHERTARSAGGEGYLG